MRSSKRRHLGLLAPQRLAAGAQLKRLFAAKAAPGTGPYESEFAPRDYLGFLLHVDAEIEHGGAAIAKR